jgi:hypothetical protein
MPREGRPARAARPGRTAGYGTIAAVGATFASLSRSATVKLPQEGAGPLGEAYRGKFAHYAPVCQGWIALTIRDPFFGPLVNFHNQGTGPELVTCGYFLAHGYTPGRDIFFQQEKIVIDDRTRRTRKDFIVDVAINSPWGGTIYLNIDGVYFHTRTELEEFKDAIRDGREGRTGRPVDVPDTDTLDPATFESFLQREGVAA